LSKTPYLRKSSIEAKALDLIETHYQKEIKNIQGFIDIESIVESTLGYGFVFDDLSKRFNAPNILGAINGDKRVVYIDGALAEDSKQEGRFRFTISHEIGHAILHVPKPSDDVQLTLLDMDKPTSIFCREQDLQAFKDLPASKKCDSIEWQANYFASCLLMPRYHVLEALEQYYSSVKRMDYKLQDAIFVLSKQFDVSNQPMNYRQKDERRLHIFYDPIPVLAKQFGVSRQAMQYRLEEFKNYEEELMFLQPV
jgi:Zn-dependent peptidase ImmA (M78 family)